MSYSASTIASGRGAGVVRRLHSSRSCARSRHPSGPANSNGSPFRLSAFWRVWPNVIAGRPIGRGLCTQAVNNCLGIRTATSIRATCPARQRNKRLWSIRPTKKTLDCIFEGCGTVRLIRHQCAHVQSSYRVPRSAFELHTRSGLLVKSGGAGR